MGRGLARAARAAPLALALAAVGCAGVRGPGLDLWPLVVRDEAPVAGVRRTRILGPLFERFEREDGSRGWVLRPLVAHLEGPAGDRFEFLYPLGGFRREAGGTRARLTPLASGEVRSAPAAAHEPARSKAAKGGGRSDHGQPGGHGEAGRPAPAAPGGRRAAASQASFWILGPFFFGRSASGARSLGFFPLGGVVRERFGRERIEFVLFPLFGRSRDERGFERTTVLWPFLSWGHGGGRRLLRIWPFYGSDAREERYERRFVLWPLVHLRHEGIGGPTERRVRLFLPFYGEIRSRHARARLWLGPLHMESRNDLTGERSSDWLWPFVHLWHRPARDGYAGGREVRLLPLFRWRSEPGRREWSLLEGGLAHVRLAEPDLSLDRWRWLWVSRVEQRDEKGGEHRWLAALWPWALAEERWDQGGLHRGELRVPWLLPLRGAGFERHWLELATLYERSWRGGEERSDLAWGLVRHRRSDAGTLDAISWIGRRWRPTGSPSEIELFGFGLRP